MDRSERNPLDLPSLALSEFPAFFAAIHGVAPFPWPVRLNEQLGSNGGLWPQQISIPWACGIAAVIDIAIFQLALQVELEDRRLAPIRVARVTDRRCALDVIEEHAQALARALRESVSCKPDASDIIARVARRLIYLSGSLQPLLVSGLEAGLPEEGDWTPSPLQPTVLFTTVDQFGSRLLFRGMGVSTSMSPIHAGLLGADCLVIVDEPQMSEAFLQTLSLVDTYRRPPWCERSPPPWQRTALRSMPLGGFEPPFMLNAEDREHPVLSQRLRASKPVRLVRTNIPSTAIVAHAKELVSHIVNHPRPQPSLVGLIVNTVELAVACHTVLLNQLHSTDGEVVLLVGRSRLFERTPYLRRATSTLRSPRGAEERPLYVIATQCIEVGAHIDFDLLVSQVAPLDSLRHRFSQLNLSGRPISAQGIIVACRDELGARSTDPIYGAATKATWDWLQDVATDGERGVRVVDFGTQAMERYLVDFDAANLRCQVANSPVVMPDHLDQLSQTAPVPITTPEIGLLLHGVPNTGTVQVIWRQEINLTSDEAVEYSKETLENTPPDVRECIVLPLVAVRAWLDGEVGPPIADLEGVPQSLARSAAWQPGRRPALRWRRSDGGVTGKINAAELLPGDVIVVPCIYGGIDSLGCPNLKRFSGPPARDVSEALELRERLRSPLVRLDPSSLEFELSESTTESDGALLAEQVWTEVWRLALSARETDDPGSVAQQLAKIEGMPRSWRRRLKKLANTTGVKVVLPNQVRPWGRAGIMFIDPSPTNDGLYGVSAQYPSTTELHRPQFSNPPLRLDEYLNRFERIINRLATVLPIERWIAPDLALAASLSCGGAEDSRYQAYLRGGDWLSPFLEQEPIMTLTVRFANASAAARARERVGLPERWCHEAAAVVHASSCDRLATARDRWLVLWLIGTCFGSGRPLYPHADPEHAGPQDLDWLVDGVDWCQVFGTLRRRYGWWGLAYLEAVFRLAEHRIWSEEPDNADATRRVLAS